MPGGLFITFEGGDGSGKSAQVESLVNRLRRRKASVTTVREPGGTQLGTLLRQVLKFSTAPRSSEAELLLFNASRAQLVSEVIRPALEKGRVVVSDRFTDSTLAYQGYGRGVSLEYVEAVNNVATTGVRPDLTILLDIPPEEGLKRSLTVGERFEWGSAEGSATPEAEQGAFHFVLPGLEGERSVAAEAIAEGSFTRGPEQEQVMEFHRRVRQGYLELAHREPERWHTIDALLSKRKISQLVWQRVESMLPTAGQAKG